MAETLPDLGDRRAKPLLLLLVIALLPGLLFAGGRLLAAVAARPLPTIPGPRQPFDASPPPDLHGAAAALDLQSRDVVLFGGYHPSSGGHVTDETWAWDGLDWRRLRPPVSPPPRRDALAVMDLASRTIVVTGGFGGGPRTPLNDLWSWDGRTWSPLPARGVKPHPALLPMASWDVRDHSLLVVCTAMGETGLEVQTWEYGNGAWTRRTPPREPQLRGSGLMSADPTTGHSLLVAPGPDPDGPAATWSWDGSAWNQVASTPAGFSASSARLAADGIVAGDVILTMQPATTWVWDGSRWLVPATSVMPPVQGALVATLGSPILFGGTSLDRNLVVKFRWAATSWLPLDLPVRGGDQVIGRRVLATPPPRRDMSTPPPLPT